LVVAYKIAMVRHAAMIIRSMLVTARSNHNQPNALTKGISEDKLVVGHLIFHPIILIVNNNN